MSELVRVEVDGGIATIRLDRPPMNALNAEIQGALAAACAEVGADESVAAVIGIPAVEEHLPPDSTIQQARVEMWQAVMCRQLAGDRAFARRGRAVDRDDHAERLRARNAFTRP